MAKFLLMLGIMLAVIVIASELTEARGRVRVRSSRTRARSGSGSSGTSRTRRHFSPAGSRKVTKYTPIPVLTRASPVIQRQTRLSPSSNLYRRAFFGYIFYRFALNKMPVYRKSFNMPNSVVQIPEERALRISNISETIKDINGSVCLGSSSKTYTVMAGVNVSSVHTRLTVDFIFSLLQIRARLTNFTLDKDLLNKNIRVRTVVIYDGNMIANTTCRQVESQMDGTVVRMYETNPDVAGIIGCNLLAVALSSIFYLFFLQ